MDRGALYQQNADIKVKFQIHTNRRLSSFCLQRSMTDKLQTRVESLLEERNKLQSSVKDLRVSIYSLQDTSHEFTDY